MIEQFQIAGTQLQPGVTLIEASAGTGKTYTIAGIFLRLILEQRLPIEKILAVTYTVAATEELRDRVRKRLRDALEELRAGESEDPIVSAFLNRQSSLDRQFAPGHHERQSKRSFLEDSIGSDQGIRDLDAAVQNFDQAQIFTIHGFCQRVLRNNAFESGVLFDMELITDPGAIFDQIAQDFWRQQFYQAGPLPSRLALAHGRSPDSWIELLQRIRNHPDLRILPEAGSESLEELTADLGRAFEAIKQEWEASHVEISRILAEDKGLSRSREKKKGFSAETCAEYSDHFSKLCSNIEEADPECLKAIECLSTSGILARTKPSKSPPAHAFFEHCEEFQQAAIRFFYKLDSEFIAFARRELPVRKARLNVLSFDDLLIRLRDALSGVTGNTLAGELRHQYQAALIDEFQDTDPVQYEIFSKLFAGGEHRLFFIGDPKQAIYGFRGADVFTYLEAAHGAAYRYTLGTNFRSEKPLLDAVNLIFGNEDPFMVEEIAYRPVQPPEKPRNGFTVLIQEMPEAALQCRLIPANGDKGLSQGDSEALINQAVVAEIAKLKASGARLGRPGGESEHSRPITYGDMAVLVRSNAQAAKLPELLRAHGIKSVLQTDQSVFDTEEATELLRLMEGVLEPGRDASLKTALATCFVGLCAADILKCESDEAERQRWLDLFIAYRKLWEASCFVAVFRRILVDQKVRERVVQWPGGERRLTNFLHLAELLHQAETEQRLGTEALCAWLSTQRSSATRGADEYQLRLESDEDAVVIATIHKSKGLEYPIVFCPFLWKAGDSSRRTEMLFHDPNAENRLTLDLRPKAEAGNHDELTANEKRAEALRVAYVALTRAKNRCYLYAGAIKDFCKSPLAHLLGTDDALAGLTALADVSGGSISVSEIDSSADNRTDQSDPTDRSDESAAPLAARTFKGTIPTSRMMASFTGLLSGRHEEEPDRDAVSPGEPVRDAESPQAALGEFKRGATAGLFFHEVLENLDFQKPSGIEELVSQKLVRHGITTGNWKEPLCANLRQLLDLRLPGSNTLQLNRILSKERLPEVEFCHPVASLTPTRLRALFESHGGPQLPPAFPESLGRLQFNPVEGFMRGFIDLLFRFEDRYYLIDWKSNWLGNHLTDYDAPGIRACMLEHNYYLQYHLYTLATDLFLNQRIADYDYEKHFGGVFYIFLRGIDPNTPGRGVFHDRPAAGLVAEMRNLMLGGLQ